MKRLLLVTSLLYGQTSISTNQVRKDQLLIVHGVKVINNSGGFHLHINAVTAPTTTITPDDNVMYDAVLYLDIVDKKLKIRHNDGSVVSLEP